MGMAAGNEQKEQNANETDKVKKTKKKKALQQKK